MPTIRDRARGLLKSGDLCDCEFLVGTDKVKIRSHKLILGMSSPVFYAMFYGEMAEKNTIEIKDLQPAAFEGMLEFIYTDNVDFLSGSHACTVYTAAVKYMLTHLEKECIDYILESICACNVCDIFDFAVFHDLDDVQEECLRVFRSNTRAVMKSTGFIDADFTTVLTFFDQEDLELDSELHLFQGLQAWTQAEARRTGTSEEALASTLTEAINKINFLKMTAEEFTSGPALSALLTSDEKLAITMNITQPGVVEIPGRIASGSTRRVALSNTSGAESEVVIPPLEWSLERVPSYSITYPITRWLNPFSRKGLTVSRNVKLKGVKMLSQRMSTTVEGPPLTYKEDVTIILKKDWAVTFSGVKYEEETPFNSTFQVLFHHPVPLEANKKYWLIVQFDKGGEYQFTREENPLYEVNNLKVNLHEQLCPFTELIFYEQQKEKK